MAGCGHSVEISLRQPFAPTSQANLTLVGDSAFHAADGGRQRCLLTFRLPGAEKGPRAFLVYFAGPEGFGDLRVDPEDPDAVRGFLIQEIGQLAGRTGFVGGVIRCRKRWWKPGERRLELDVRCDDGTRIHGRADVREDARRVHAFEREFAADVAGMEWQSASRTGSGPVEAAGSSQP